MKEQTGAMDDLYRELNTHNPHIDLQNKKNGEFPSADRKSAGIKNVHSAHNVKTCCVTSFIFDTCYKFVWDVLHAEQ